MREIIAISLLLRSELFAKLQAEQETPHTPKGGNIEKDFKDGDKDNPYVHLATFNVKGQMSFYYMTILTQCTPCKRVAAVF